MRRPVIASLLLAAATATPVVAATRGFPVASFDRVRSGGPYDVRIHTGAAPSVRATGPQAVLDRLRIEVRGGELAIGTQPGNWLSGWNMGWAKHEHTVIDVTLPMLAGVALSGPGDISVDRVRTRAFTASLSGPGDLTIGALEAAQADLSLSGPGDMTVSGRAGRARITLSGPGDVHGKGFTAGDLVVDLSGPGDVETNAARTADIHLSGPGDVTVGGHPRCTISKHGPGDVACG